MEDLKLNELDVNETEQRYIFAQFGLRLPRGFSSTQAEEAFNNGDEFNTDQVKLRTETQVFVVKNWEYLKNIAEVYGCTGDCVESTNKCTDARAVSCYKECFPSKRKRRRRR